MGKKSSLVGDTAFFNLPHARWVIGVLSMLIAVVGRDSVVGLILRQARFEVTSLVREAERNPAAQRAARYRYN